MYLPKVSSPRTAAQSDSNLIPNTKFQAFNSVKTLGDSDVSPSYS